MATTAAIAQGPDPSGLTGLDPLTRIVEGFGSSAEAESLYLQGESDAGPTGLTQFQVIVNMGGSSTFGEDGLEMIPSGLTDDGDLISLEENFGGTIGTSGTVPPLAPFARGRAMDLTEVFEGWTAYGNQGPVEGPIEVLEGVQVVAGIELPEPYDHECAERTHVGRAWVGSTVSAPDPLFTAEALLDKYGDSSHSVLAGRASRVIELTCFPGGGPFMVSSRMREDAGIRPFGPLEIFGLVKGNHVVIIAPIRVLDDDLTQRFYSTPSGGGDVVLSEVDDGARLLVPNPYGPNDIRVEIRAVTAPADAGAANPSGNSGDTRTLLYQENGGGSIIPIQTGGGCTLFDQLIHILATNEFPDGSIATFDIPESYSIGPSFGSTTSSSGTTEVQEGGIVSVIADGTGTTQTLTLNSDGTGEFEKSPASGPGCGGPIEFDMSPYVFIDLSDSTDDSSGEATTDDGGSDDESAGEVPGETSEDDNSPGGVPWGPIGIAIGLLAVATGTAVARRRSRTKDCKPEEAAYAAAVAAYEKAKKAAEYYTGEFNHYNGEYNDYRNLLENRLDAPDRVRAFPEGPDGDKAYADSKARWDAREAKAERAEDNLDGARQNMESAKSDMDNAVKALQAAADLIKQTNEALRACKGSAPELPGDDTETPPTTPGAGGSGPSSPGTITDPPDTTEPECLEGTTKVRVESQKSFEILDGEVRIQLNKTKLNDTYPGGLIDADELKTMGEDDLQDLFSQLEENIREENMRWVIDTTILTVKCIRIVICQGGRWVETDQTNRVEERAKGPSYQKATKTQSKVLAQRLMTEAQSKVTELQANEAAAAAFTCD